VTNCIIYMQLAKRACKINTQFPIDNVLQFF